MVLWRMYGHLEIRNLVCEGTGARGCGGSKKRERNSGRLALSTYCRAVHRFLPRACWLALVMLAAISLLPVADFMMGRWRTPTTTTWAFQANGRSGAWSIGLIVRLQASQRGGFCSAEAGLHAALVIGGVLQAVCDCCIATLAFAV